MELGSNVQSPLPWQKPIVVCDFLLSLRTVIIWKQYLNYRMLLFAFSFNNFTTLRLRLNNFCLWYNKFLYKYLSIYLSNEPCLEKYANNKGADQPAHLRSLISTFVVHCLDSKIPIPAISKVSRLASLCCWAGQFESCLVRNPEDRFPRYMCKIHLFCTVVKCMRNSYKSLGEKWKKRIIERFSQEWMPRKTLISSLKIFVSLAWFKLHLAIFW